MCTVSHRSAAATTFAAVSLAIAASSAMAGGFQLNETSVSGLGTAFAGGAAAAEDASTIWSNAAGLSRLHGSQVTGALHLVTPSLKFRNEASVAAVGQRLGGSGGDAGGTNAVPNLYLSKQLDASWTVGLGVNAPWGLVTEYDAGWIGRFQAVRSSIRTVNLNPALSWRASDGLALGLGLNAQHLSAEFTNQVNYAGALLSAAALNGVAPGTPAFNAIAAAAAGLESRARVKGSDNGTGWNAGVLWEFDRGSRIGAQYRSGIRYRIDGTARFDNPAVAPAPALLGVLANGVNAAALFDTRISSDVKIPAVANLSYVTALNDRWELLADAQWTRWSSIRNLRFVRADGTELQNTPENFRNTWKVALGANYRYSPQWKLRGGVALDESPVQAAFRTPRLPDADRTWLALGAQYVPGPQLRIDMGAAYLFVKKAAIRANGDPSNASAALANGLIDGHYKNRTVILSVQVDYAF